MSKYLLVVTVIILISTGCYAQKAYKQVWARQLDDE